VSLDDLASHRELTGNIKYLSGMLEFSFVMAVSMTIFVLACDVM